MTYRLYRRHEVVKGEYYYSVACHKCEQLIYILDDTSKGQTKIDMGKDASFLIPCSNCKSDDTYSIEDFMQVIAEESLPPTYPARNLISKSSRKPLKKHYPNASVIMGVGYIEDRPKAAALVGKIVTSWADVEVQCAMLLAELMNAQIPEGAALFGSLRSSRAQSDALSAVAEISLDKKDLKLFDAFIKRKAALEKERNDLAHGCFGVSVSIPEHIVWVSQSDFLNYSAALKSSKEPLTLRDKQFVYELGTLERIASEIEEYYNQLRAFIGYLSAREGGQDGAIFRKTRYPELCNFAFIKQHIK